MKRNVESYVEDLSVAISKISGDELRRFTTLLWDTRKSSGTVFLAGNGGSAATASHAAVDWMLGSGVSEPALRVVALTESVASITATGNDYEFREVFSRSLAHLARPGDLFLAISASGNSPNLVSATKQAKVLGVTTAALTGFDGGWLKNACDVSIHVPTENRDYGVSEDAHLAVVHMIKELLMRGPDSDA